MVVVLLSFMKETTVCAIWTNWVAGPGEPPWDDFSWHRNKLLKSHPILGLSQHCKQSKLVIATFGHSNLFEN